MSIAQSRATRNLAVPAGNLGQIDRLPDEPGRQASQFDAHHLGDRRISAQRCQLSQTVKLNLVFLDLRKLASTFAAQTLACRTACCAVGGEVILSGCGTEAQSPMAQR